VPVILPIEACRVNPTATLRECIQAIDIGAKGIALVVGDDGRLIATITDGDIRRALLAGSGLDQSLEKLVREKQRNPIAAAVDTPEDQLVRIMTEGTVRHLPLVDGDDKVVGIALLDELVREYELPIRAVVMAGGLGLRLRPLTETVPKPLLPVGERPLLEILVDQLRDSGIRQINITTHYLGESIREHIGDGERFGVNVEYVDEKEPLGTAGALSLIESNEPLLVVNGDILTRVDFRAMLRFHQKHEADMTVGVRQQTFDVPFGVVHTQGTQVDAFEEKPSASYLVNTGIYLLESHVRKLVPADSPSDMPSLISAVMENGGRVSAFPIHEYWTDIGRMDDYAKAQADIDAERYPR
jgi:dTDP-glucose pyrophosphorylase